jgi:predicted secreted protein
MGQGINGFDIVFTAMVAGTKKLFAGTKTNSFNINPRVKESITKEDRGTTNKKITGYDTEFGVEGVMEINSEEEKTKRVDREDIIDLVTAGEPLEYVYGDATPGNTVRKGKMVITAYSESTDAEGEATYSLSCAGITKMTKELIPAE